MSPNRPFDDDNDDLPGGRYTEHRANPDRADREISLGTPTILGIFFALALVCALFFGFGYAMGHKSSPPVVAAIDPASGVSVSAAKPAAGSLAPHSSAPAQQANADPTPSPTPSQTSPTQTATVSLAPPATPKKTVAPADRMIVGDNCIRRPGSRRLQPGGRRHLARVTPEEGLHGSRPSRTPGQTPPRPDRPLQRPQTSRRHAKTCPRRRLQRHRQIDPRC